MPCFNCGEWAMQRTDDSEYSAECFWCGWTCLVFESIDVLLAKEKAPTHSSGTRRGE